jgi:Na+-transporting methylmalonyl-CoA/oxaloacetate decarboxylase gamma subunit
MSNDVSEGLILIVIGMAVVFVALFIPVVASRWAVAGRERAMRSRQNAGRQWRRRSD